MKWTDLNLSALQYFIDAVDLGSLTMAGEKNYVSRPAISQAIKRIEDSLGYNLLTHNKNKLELTTNGRSFYQKAKKGIEAFSFELSHSERHSNKINIACSATLAEYVLLPTLKKMKIESQRKIQIQIGSSAKVRQLVLDGEAQIGLLIDDNQTHGLHSTPIMRGKFVLQSKSAHLSMPLITTEPRPEVIHLFKVLSKAKKDIDCHVQAESWSLCRKTLETLGGTCLVPDLIKMSGYKTVQKLSYNYEYEVLALCKNSNTLNEAEHELLKRLCESFA